MPRRKDSFSRALADAQKRLAKAIEEKKATQSKLYALEMEIPALLRTIAALKGHFEPVQVPADRVARRPEIPPANMTPEETAKWYTERDLSNVGSVVPERPAAELVDEDELLPDDFATGKR